MLSRRVGAIILGVAAGSLLVSACGSSAPSASSNGVAKKSPAAQVHAALEAASAASSTRISGTISNGSDHVVLDMLMFKNGDTDGSFGLAASPAHMLIVNQVVYLRGSASFWEALGSDDGSTMPASDAAALANRWVSLPTTATSTFSTFTLPGLVSALGSDKKKFTSAGTRTIDGRPAVGVDGSAQGVLWISTTGTAYPLEVTKASSSSTKEQITFSDWDKGSLPTAPAGAKSITKLVAGG